MRRLSWRLLVVAVLAISAVDTAFAGDWVAVKLRGAVFALENGAWQQLQRGDVISDDRIIRSAGNGRAQFKRDNETIDLAPQTQIRIFDEAGRKFTVVQQHFGEVAIEAEKREVQHFAVQTRVLAAVVKGTRFVVRTDGRRADVDVARGRVEVRDTERQLVVNVDPGQSASVSESENLTIQGRGQLDQVATFTGHPLAETVKIEQPVVSNVNPDSSVTANPNGKVVGNAVSNAVSNAGGNGNGNAGNSNAGGNGNGVANGLNNTVNSVGNAVSNAVSNAGGNGNGNGNSGNSNAGGNGNGVANGLSNTVSETVNSVGNAVSNAVSNAGGNGNGNSGNSNAGGNGNGNSGNSNAGGNGNGNGNNVVEDVVESVGGLL